MRLTLRNGLIGLAMIAGLVLALPEGVSQTGGAGSGAGRGTAGQSGTAGQPGVADQRSVGQGNRGDQGTSGRRGDGGGIGPDYPDGDTGRGTAVARSRAERQAIRSQTDDLRRERQAARSQREQRIQGTDAYGYRGDQQQQPGMPDRQGRWSQQPGTQQWGQQQGTEQWGQQQPMQPGQQQQWTRQWRQPYQYGGQRGTGQWDRSTDAQMWGEWGRTWGRPDPYGGSVDQPGTDIYGYAEPRAGTGQQSWRYRDPRRYGSIDSLQWGQQDRRSSQVPFSQDLRRQRGTDWYGRTWDRDQFGGRGTDQWGQRNGFRRDSRYDPYGRSDTYGYRNQWGREDQWGQSDRWDETYPRSRAQPEARGLQRRSDMDRTRFGY